MGIYARLNRPIHVGEVELLSQLLAGGLAALLQTGCIRQHKLQSSNSSPQAFGPPSYVGPPMGTLLVDPGQHRSPPAHH